MEVKKQRRSTSVNSNNSNNSKRGRYGNKARQYNSPRRGNNNNNNDNNNNGRRRRSRRLANKNGGDQHIQQPNPIQNPIIINGVDDIPQDYNHDDVMEIHGSQSPAFMPSAHYNPKQTQTKYVLITIHLIIHFNVFYNLYSVFSVV